ncbi:TetR family transcriptional regulator C-terminal domain-containing protein [Actinomycetospora sp. CA-084318]|uniref:TetR family transcriptional regulator C-terminal domain-containing protein n=1 Tax=Actinomycetospora sp. CA-084318 TaxID=3239892 RepID=UPI003D964ABE
MTTARRRVRSKGDDPTDRVLAVFDLLGKWFEAPGYRGCPFINVAAEYAVAGPVAVVLDRHRSWVRDLFAGLLEEAGHPAPRATARQLVLLYDGAMVAAHLDADPTAAQDAREAARGLLSPEPAPRTASRG